MTGLYLRTLLLLTLVGTPVLFSSCHSSRPATQSTAVHPSLKSPSFLDDMSFKGPVRSIAVTGLSPETTFPRLNPSAGNSLQLKYSAMMQVLPNAIRNLSLYKFIDEWYGVRYQYGGNTKNGIDCSAFVQRMYGEVFGMDLLRTAINQAGMTRLLWSREVCKEGDLVFFNTRGHRISHVGIYLINNFFVHASTSQGIMISRLDDGYWENRFSCAGRLL